MRENIDSLQSQIDGLGQSILKLENSRENKLNVYEAILRHDRNIGGKSRGVESGQKKGVSSPLKPPGGLSPEKRTERFNERIDKLRDRAAKTDDPEGAAVAKKKLEEQRQELKVFLNLTFGPNSYNELLAMEGKIRKDRQKMIYERQQLREQILSVIGIIFVSITIVGFIVFVLMMLKEKYGW